MLEKIEMSDIQIPSASQSDCSDVHGLTHAHTKAHVVQFRRYGRRRAMRSSSLNKSEASGFRDNTRRHCGMDRNGAAALTKSLRSVGGLLTLNLEYAP
jgi:hypothetical protein